MMTARQLAAFEWALGLALFCGALLGSFVLAWWIGGRDE